MGGKFLGSRKACPLICLTIHLLSSPVLYPMGKGLDPGHQAGIGTMLIKLQKKGLACLGRPLAARER